ncbi:MAG: pyridoxine 5'-phosphate synthase [Bacteroidales bacterium]|jgi:pyridoxine 5-phosphate synthase|nr:pyridoxine 5'-phosphate synthase [Bacteroidales bacterium]MCI2122036.1 pyridoxine 5'-phosphate synthase [Bacteroidales bacterium]MCI2145333.1 pyridoxine 5'-phosphate synthase [Bacteroidales bacterium]
MTRLSVNINKFATLRNARGGNNPDVLKVAKDCERFGAQGITVHPRPDHRHIRYTDVTSLKPILTTEFNIEGNPIPEFINLVIKVKPAQVTLVPDAPDALTSNHGWNPKANMKFLKETCARFNDAGIRTSIFIDPIPEMIDYASETGCKRVELYTAAYAEGYGENPDKALEPYYKAALEAHKCGLGLNAGHDLNLENLRYFVRNIEWTDEVSIGHALICDALYLGLEKTVKSYLEQLA